MERIGVLNITIGHYFIFDANALAVHKDESYLFSSIKIILKN